MRARHAPLGDEIRTSGTAVGELLNQSLDSIVVVLVNQDHFVVREPCSVRDTKSRLSSSVRAMVAIINEKRGTDHLTCGVLATPEFCYRFGPTWS